MADHLDLMCIIHNELRGKKLEHGDHRLKHLRYLRAQVFYGFSYYPELHRGCDASSRAMEAFSQKNNGEDLRTKNWSDQQAFDAGREIFHLEHIFTGSMFFAKLNEHYEVTRDCVEKILKENYAVAWILREENQRLPKRWRGKSLESAIESYKNNGINLVGPIS